MCILDHLDGCRHGVDICCHPHQIDDTVSSVDDVLLVVASSDICHNRDLQICIVLSDDGSYVLLVTELPFAEFVHIKHFLGGLIAEFHIINPRLDVRFIEGSYKLVSKIEVIDKSSISYCCVKYLNVRSVGDQISAYHNSVLLLTFLNLNLRHFNALVYVSDFV